MLEFLSYVAARVIAGVMTALILAVIFNHQCNKAVQFTGAATAGDLFVINSPRESSWISTVSDVASTWLWEHSDLIPLMAGEVAVAAVIVAVFVWRERRKTQRADAETMRRIGAMEFNDRREED